MEEEKREYASHITAPIMANPYVLYLSADMSRREARREAVKRLVEDIFVEPGVFKKGQLYAAFIPVGCARNQEMNPDLELLLALSSVQILGGLDDFDSRYWTPKLEGFSEDLTMRRKIPFIPYLDVNPGESMLDVARKIAERDIGEVSLKCSVPTDRFRDVVEGIRKKLVEEYTCEMCRKLESIVR